MTQPNSIFLHFKKYYLLFHISLILFLQLQKHYVFKITIQDNLLVRLKFTSSFALGKSVYSAPAVLLTKLQKEVVLQKKIQQVSNSISLLQIFLRGFLEKIFCHSEHFVEKEKDDGRNSTLFQMSQGGVSENLLFTF